LRALGLRPEALPKDLKDTSTYRDAALAAYDAMIASTEAPEEVFAASPPRTASVSFDADDELATWLTDGSENVFLLPETTVLRTPAGEDLRDVLIRLPLGRLPIVRTRRGEKVRGGFLYAEKTLTPPLDASKCAFIEVHLQASTDLGAGVYFHGVGHSVRLHAGEQIVRIDLRRYGKNAYCDYGKWDKLIRRIAFRFFPQGQRRKTRT